MKIKNFILEYGVEFLVILSFGVFASLFYTQYPPPWPDEPFYITIIDSFVKNGVLGTTIYGSAIPGMDKAMFFYPPLYFLTLVPLVAFFGAKLEVLRFFSISCSVVTLVFIARILRHLISYKSIRYATLIALSFNTLYIRGARVGRMDTFVLMLIVMSAYYFLRFIQKYMNGKTEIGCLILASIFTALLGVTHPVAAFIYASSVMTIFFGFKLKEFFKLSSLYTILPVALFLIWCVYVFTNIDLFSAQMEAQMTRKDEMLLTVFSGIPAYYFTLPVLGISLIVSYIVTKGSGRRYLDVIFIFLSLFFSLAMFSLSREMWYIIFPLSFMWIVGALLLDRFLKLGSEPLRYALSALMILVFIGCISKNMYNVFGDHSLTEKNYSKFCEALKVDTIPEGSKLYFGGVPEAYFCFENIDKFTVLGYIATGVKVDKDKWLNDLKDVDYFFLGFEPSSIFLIDKGIDRELTLMRRADFDSKHYIAVYK